MSAIMVLSFPTFLTIIETKYCGTLDEIAIVEAIEELYQTYVQDVIKKVSTIKFPITSYYFNFFYTAGLLV